MGWGYIDEEPSWRPPTELPNLKGEIRIAIDTETYDPHLLDRGAGNVFNDGCVIGISMAVSPTDKWYCPIKSPFNDGFAIEEIREWADRTFNDTTVCIGANLMYDIGWLDYHGINIKGSTYDVQWVEALLNEHKNSYSLDNIALDYGLGGKNSDALYKWCAEKFGGKADGRQRKHMHEVPLSLVGPYAEADAYLPLQIAELQQPQVEADGLEQVVDLEHRLMPMLLAMRKRGVRVNMEGRQTLTDYLDKTLIEAKETVRRVAGREVNVNAAADIAKVFDSNGWDYPLTAKAQKPSFTKGFLTTCDHEFGKAIAAVRRLGKMKTTFVDGYFGLAYNGRIHSNLHPLRTGENGTVSGRLSCIPDYVQVTMKGGTRKPMSEVVPGDEVITHTGAVREVLNKWFTSVDDVYRMCLCGGEELDCTTTHRILTCDGWKTLGEIHEHFKNSNKRCTKMPEDSVLLYGRGETVYRGYCQGNTGNIPKCTACSSTRHPARCVQERESSSLCSEQGRRAEPNDREVWRPASYVQGSVGGRERLSDSNNPKMDDKPCFKQSISPCGSVAKGTRDDGTTSRVSSTSHQPCNNGQSTSKPGARVCVCSSCAPCYASCVRSVEHVGIIPVFDMEVEADHSFIANGVMVHNCSNPNSQNIPSNDKEFAPLIRGLFVPDEGERWVCLDFSQIEYRLLAHYALGKGADEVRRKYNADPTTDFHKLVQDATGLDRKCAKKLNFSQVYGAGITLTAETLGVDIETAHGFRDVYFSRAPYIKATSDAVMNRAQNRGWIKTIMGRRARFTSWEPSSFDLSKELGTFPTREEALEVTARHLDVDIACTQIIKRARTYKALNALLQGSAADLMKKAMVDVWESGVCDVLGAPLLTVHDELDWSKPQTKEGDEAIAHAAHLMCNALPEIRVPVLVDCEEGDDWGHIA